MDGAPLIQAYDHAKTAALQTYKGSLNAARESHELAAGDFERAAGTTDDVEALRLLKLLEENHRELARAIATSNLPKPSMSSSIPEETGKVEKGAREERTTDASKQDGKSTEATGSQATSKNTPANSAVGSLRRPPRGELASSIASNLATARGKPPQEHERDKRLRKGTEPGQRGLPSTPEVTAHNAVGSIPGRAKGGIPPPIIPTRNKSPPRAYSNLSLAAGTPSGNTAPSATTEAFNAFYTSFETIFSKLPASLAFAGLPLTASGGDSKPQDKTPSRKGREGRSARATNEPDLKSIFSPATVRAVQEDGGLAVQESFYLVNSTDPHGRQRLQRSGRHGNAEDEDLDDIGSDAEFVDARESLANSLLADSATTSPRGSRTHASKQTEANKGIKKVGKLIPGEVTLSRTGKTMEELELQNTAYQDLLNNQARRLQMWEASAQSQSMALHKSLRLNKPPSLSSAAAVAAAKKKGLSPMEAEQLERIKMLEEELGVERASRETLERKNDKLMREQERLFGVLGKYREKWEMLKESARAREKRKTEAAGAAGTG